MPSLINYLCYSLRVLSTVSFIALTLDMANNQATGNNMQPLNKYTEQFYASLAKKKNKENNYLYGFCFICGTL